MHGKLRLALMTPLLMACAACGPTRIERIKPPADLLACADEPTAPDLPGRDQQAVRDAMTLNYLLSLRSAWGDCHSKIAGLAAWAKEN
ncbi:Rz1-like lysis system protein LysC [Novosphingobium olei]|uniref:Rz1-like lysis system protein LysC n=1 Tax=Novosphingobium olei TaxID=2728851 RepID=UPI003BAFD9E1